MDCQKTVEITYNFDNKSSHPPQTKSFSNKDISNIYAGLNDHKILGKIFFILMKQFHFLLRYSK